MKSPLMTVMCRCVADRLCCTSSQQDQYNTEVTGNKRFTLNSKKLKPYLRYSVIVQAKMCPGNLYEGPWSEWSPATEWRTQGDEPEGTKSPHRNHFCHLGPVGKYSRGF